MPNPAPDYRHLAHLINAAPILESIAGQMAKRYQLGDEITSTDFLHRIYEEYGERGVVTNCVRHFLRTLGWFGCLERLAPNRYRFNTRLSVQEGTFPLLVYSWLHGGAGTHQFTQPEFAQQPASYFLDLDGLDKRFSKFSGRFWAVEKRMGLERVTMKYAQVEAFQAALVSNL